VLGRCSNSRAMVTVSHAADYVACQQGGAGLNTSLTSSTSPRDPGTDQTE